MTAWTPVFDAVVKTSIAGGVLVGVVLAVQWIFRKQLSPQWRAALWLLVAVRLLPISVPSEFSLFNFVPAWLQFASFDRSVAATAEIAGPATVVAGTMAQGTIDERDRAKSWNEITPAAIVRGGSGTGWHAMAFYLWFLGGCGFAGYVALTFLSFRRLVQPAQPLDNPGATDLLHECAALLQVRRIPQLIETDAVQSPCLYGFVRARILLPIGFTRDYSRSELRHVFLHELAHVRRGDIAVGWLFTSLQIVHWFNPLVWLAVARWRADREIACDACALAASGVAHKCAYGRTILRLLENVSVGTRGPGLAGITERRRNLNQRITLIAQFTPARRPIAGLLLFPILGLLGLTDAAETTRASSGERAEMQADRANSAALPPDVPTPVVSAPAEGPDESKAPPNAPSRQSIEAFMAAELATRFEGDRSKFLSYLRSQGKTVRDYRREMEERVKASGVKLPAARFDAEPVEEIRLRLIQLNRKPEESDGALLVRANEVLRRLKGGAPFSELALEFSQDRMRHKGGDWGWLKRTDFRPEFSEVAFALDIGEASPPIVLPEGCFILFVEERRIRNRNARIGIFRGLLTGAAQAMSTIPPSGSLSSPAIPSSKPVFSSSVEGLSDFKIDTSTRSIRDLPPTRRVK